MSEDFFDARTGHVHPGLAWMMLSQPDGKLSKEHKGWLRESLDKYPERDEEQ